MHLRRATFCILTACCISLACRSASARVQLSYEQIATIARSVIFVTCSSSGAVGSGFVFGTDRSIITAFHAVADAAGTYEIETTTSRSRMRMLRMYCRAPTSHCCTRNTVAAYCETVASYTNRRAAIIGSVIWVTTSSRRTVDADRRSHRDGRAALAVDDGPAARARRNFRARLRSTLFCPRLCGDRREYRRALEVDTQHNGAATCRLGNAFVHLRPLPDPAGERFEDVAYRYRQNGTVIALFPSCSGLIWIPRYASRSSSHVTTTVSHCGTDAYAPA